jgi:hypothetical protein
VVGSCEHCDKPSGSGTTQLVNLLVTKSSVNANLSFTSD